MSSTSFSVSARMFDFLTGRDVTTAPRQRNQIDGLRKRFEALTGPVRKTGGVR
jgi:hypothetical protein